MLFSRTQAMFRGAALLYLHVQGFFTYECFSLTSEPICSCVLNILAAQSLSCSQSQSHAVVMHGKKQGFARAGSVLAPGKGCMHHKCLAALSLSCTQSRRHADITIEVFH